MTEKIPIDQAPVITGSRYPAPYDAPCRQRLRRCCGNAADSPNIDLRAQQGRYVHREGAPYPDAAPRGPGGDYRVTAALA